MFFTAYAYIRIVLEIGTLNFNSWQQVEEDEQKDCVLDVQDASYGTKRCCCFNNITHLSVAQQKLSPWAVISHFYTLKTATSSACVPLPTQQMTLLVTHLCWNGRKGEPNNCSVILASPPLISEKCLSLNFVSYLLCKQGTACLHYQPALHTSCSGMAAFA